MERTLPALGDHELIRKISDGSYGEVWLARSELGTYRAIKRIQRNRFDSPRPFQREYEGITKFEPISRSHEGLVDILHVGREEQTAFYYVMEVADDLVTGELIDPEKYQPRTLSSEVSLRGPLAPDECIRIGIQLCRTLAFLHDRGLIHRDVKPSNVIFVGNQPKLADIGLIAGIDAAKTFVGTMGFIPPEGPNSPQADIYSLGKLLYEISTGNDRNDFPALPDRQYSEEFLELNEVIVKACNTDSKRRYRDALGMAADLEAITSGRSVRRLHHLERQMRIIRRGAGLICLGVAILGAAVYYVNESHHKLREKRASITGAKVAQGTALLKQGDLTGSLPFFVEAMELDGGNLGGETTHRLRIGAILAAAPRITKWRFPDRPIRSCCVQETHALITFDRNYSQILDLDSGDTVSSHLGSEPSPRMGAFMPQGEGIITANWDATVRIIDWKTSKLIDLSVCSEAAFSVGPSPDGRSAIIGCIDGRVYLWDRETKSCREIGKHNRAVFEAAFSPSGRMAITAGEDATARVYDVENGRERLRLDHPDWVYSAGFSPDERLVATACYDCEVRIWDVETGSEIEPSLHHEAGVRAVRFSPDGRLILTASLDGTARLWETKTHRQVELNHTLKHGARLFDACFTGSGEQILTAGHDGTLTRWDFSELRPRPQFLHKVASLARPRILVSPDGKWKLETSSTNVLVQESQTDFRTEIHLTACLGPTQFDNRSTRLCVADGTNVYLLDLQKRKWHSLPHPDPITFVQFSSDGMKLVCAAADKTVNEMSAQIWDAETAIPIGSPLQHQDGVLYAGFSPDDKRVITTSEDSSAIIWAAGSGKRLTSKMRHRDKVRFAAFAKRQPWVVTASDDRTAIVWDAENGNPLTPPFRHEKRLLRAEFIEEDTALITTDEAGGLWKWKLPIEKRSVRELSEVVKPFAEFQNLAE